MGLWAGSRLCLSFKRELFEAVHDFRLHEFRLALYTPAATLDEHISSYTTEGEVLPIDGYATGGRVIQADWPLLVSETAIVPFQSVVWSPASFKARGAICYNASQSGLPAVFTLDFGAEREANGRNFTVQFRGPDPKAAIVRLM